MKISFDTRKKLLDYLRSDFDREKERIMEQAETDLRQVWERLFEDLHSGKISCAWYYANARKNLYTITRSIKQDGYLQKSCFWLTGGQVIALSDQQYQTVKDMQRLDHIPDGITVYTC